ncbi:UDP-N-acetylmuramoyl-L-alanyl-D-glutamate--2,6-diaminopimelate ligase [Candidatus Saccharibacteria bacterium]|nr:UDP-N-acetylmuramoyl-L-alanyl-D-glutamate--2,6-diaminopimelate ligase [Candidatus Saccharibacteria bacterium]
MSFRSVVKVLIPRKLFRRIEPYGHLGEAVLFNIVHGFPARGLKVIGVTGTNGKTTTCFLIHRMMVQAGYKVGLMTTVGWGVGEDIKPQIHHMTNVAVPELMQRLKQMKKAGTEWLVLETTSHALAQNRVWGIPYSLAVMTNVTHEHLDYHGTFEKYRDDKRRLFKLTNRNKKGLRTGVINAEDPSAKLFQSAIKNSLTYGIKAGEIRASKIKSAPIGSVFDVKSTRQKKLKLHIRTRLAGSFNVYNCLAAVGVGLVLKIKPADIEKGIAAVKTVEGRMTAVNEGQDFDVIVDYAHTPDSFEKLFKDLKPVVAGKLIVMFGSAGGQRDKLKRPVQGELAGKYCDEVILTEEDDRGTPGMEILDQIAAGAEKAGKSRNKDLFLVHDRTEAIKFTLARAKPGDTVLLLGKGHEKTIERADGEHPWDEIAAVRKALSR